MSAVEGMFDCMVRVDDVAGACTLQQVAAVAVACEVSFFLLLSAALSACERDR